MTGSQLSEGVARYVEPRVIGTEVFCECGSLMEAIEHEELDPRAAWIWWRCLRDYGHITRAVPRHPQLVPLV